MKNLRQSYMIDAPVNLVWQALTDPAMIEEWGGGPAKMSAMPEDAFSLWGGDIFGKNTQVDPRHKLVQEWKEKKWGEVPFSTVTFNLKSVAGKTELELIHEGIPDTELISIEEGWRSFYLDPLKKLVEEIADEEVEEEVGINEEARI